MLHFYNSDGIFDGSDSFVDTELLRFEQPTSNSFAFIGSNHNGAHLFIDSNYLCRGFYLFKQKAIHHGR